MYNIDKISTEYVGNLLIKCIKNNLNKTWIFSNISKSKFITWNIIEKYKDEPWDWYALSYNPNITWDIIIKNKKCEWNWNTLSINPNITWDIIIKNIDKPWNWYNISYNKNITWDIIKTNIDKPWNWISISQNPNITYDIIKKNLEYNWKSDYICANSNIKWDDIIHLNVENINVFTQNLSMNQNITSYIIETNKLIQWNWYNIAHYNKNIDIDYMINKKELFRYISYNSNLRWNIIKKYSEKKWNFQELSLNPNISLHQITNINDVPILNNIILEKIYKKTQQLLKRKEILLRYRKLQHI